MRWVPLDWTRPGSRAGSANVLGGSDSAVRPHTGTTHNPTTQPDAAAGSQDTTATAGTHHKAGADHHSESDHQATAAPDHDTLVRLLPTFEGTPPGTARRR